VKSKPNLDLNCNKPIGPKFLQAHLKALLANATPKLLKELAKRKFRKPTIQN